MSFQKPKTPAPQETPLNLSTPQEDLTSKIMREYLES
jgi:hypothetical protein